MVGEGRQRKRGGDDGVTTTTFMTIFLYDTSQRDRKGEQHSTVGGGQSLCSSSSSSRKLALLRSDPPFSLLSSPNAYSRPLFFLVVRIATTGTGRADRETLTLGWRGVYAAVLPFPSFSLWLLVQPCPPLSLWLDPRTVSSDVLSRHLPGLGILPFTLFAPTQSPSDRMLRTLTLVWLVLDLLLLAAASLSIVLSSVWKHSDLVISLVFLPRHYGGPSSSSLPSLLLLLLPPFHPRRTEKPKPPLNIPLLLSCNFSP